MAVDTTLYTLNTGYHRTAMSRLREANATARQKVRSKALRTRVRKIPVAVQQANAPQFELATMLRISGGNLDVFA